MPQLNHKGSRTQMEPHLRLPQQATTKTLDKKNYQCQSSDVKYADEYTYQTGRISSNFKLPAFHFKILVTAEIEFSVGFIFSGSLEPGAWITSTSLGIAVSQI